MVTINDINRAFDKAITNISIKCGRSGTSGSSGIIYGQGESPKFVPKGTKLTNEELNEIADTMAERWGLEVSINSKGKREVGQKKFSLWDDRHKTLIKLDKLVKYDPSWIDFTNNGAGVYDLDEVLRYYNDMPTVMKVATGGLLFETNLGACYNTTYDSRYDVANPIVLTGLPFGMGNRHIRDTDSNLQRVMYHEGGHASEEIISKKEIDVLRKTSVGKNSYDRRKCSNDEERQIYDEHFRKNRLGVTKVSNNPIYSDAQSKNDKKFASGYASDFVLKAPTPNKLTEDFAETMSVASFKDLPDKSNMKIKYSDGTVVDYDTFARDHKGTFELCCDFIDGKLEV